jgi:hypothetical protein
MPGLIVARKTRIALLLCLTLGTTLSAQAQTPSSAYLQNTYTHNDGGANTQIVNAWSFPEYRGNLLDGSALALPEVKAGSLRSIAMLVALGDERRPSFSMAVDSNVETFAGTIDGRTETLHLSYSGREVFGNPVIVREDAPAVPIMANTPSWRASIPLIRPLSNRTTHLLVTMHMLPPFALTFARELRGNMTIEINEAVVHGSRVVSGKPIVSPILLNAGTESLSRWAHTKVFPGAGQGQRDLAFVDQRSAPFHENVDISIRDRRSIVYVIGGVTFGLMYHFFRNVDLAWAYPANNAPAHRIELVPVPEPEPPEGVQVTVASEIENDAPSDFGLAMGIAFCNDRERPDGGNVSGEACTVEDHDAAEALGELPPAAIRALIAQIDAANNAGAGAAVDLRTGNARLDRWLNQDWERAANALNTAIAIVGLSNTTEEQPGKRKKKRKGKNASVVAASCANSDDTQGAQANSEDGWQQCTAQARRKLKAQEAVALVPLVQAPGEYYLRNTREFDLLVRQFRNSGKGLPPGIAGDQFGGMTRAIARDAAQTGHNLGIVYLNDPTALGGNRNPDRFRFGLEHIWAPGAGGGDNAGHREDWGALPGLPINARETLVNVIMAALTDAHADYQQERRRTGNIVRTYRRFMFDYGGQLFVITNVRIVLAQNGMVITAYPLRGARADRLYM